MAVPKSTKITPKKTTKKTAPKKTTKNLRSKVICISHKEDADGISSAADQPCISGISYAFNRTIDLCSDR